MTDVSTMAHIQSGKAKAPTNGALAQGHALAKVCIKYGEARMRAEEKEQGKLNAIVRDIAKLARDGHAEFRAQLGAELNLLKELRQSTGVSKEQTAGYSFASFEVLCSNWRTISTAIEMGYSINDEQGIQKPWALVVAESVQTKRSVATQKSPDGVANPTKKTAGRKATPLIDKAKKAAEELLENNPDSFVEFAAWIETTFKAMQKSKAAPKAEAAPF
jgi:hypothetical protein